MYAPGTRFDGRYEVIDTIGEGGCAIVFRARHAFLNSLHAVKVLLPEIARREGATDRFRAEGQIQATLRHPHIVAVTDIVTEPATGLVMPLIEGPTLSDYLARVARPLTASEVQAIFLPVLDAVGAAHAAGIVHRDLKPDNIFIGTYNGALWPMVGDFGIAKVLASGGVGITKPKTRTGFGVMGTRGYMSPEQIRSRPDVDQRADIFALGAILYECVTGKCPFAGDSEFDILEMIVHGKFERPRDEAGLMPETLVACISDSLAPDRERRPGSVARLKLVLAPALVTWHYLRTHQHLETGVAPVREEARHGIPTRPAGAARLTDNEDSPTLILAESPNIKDAGDDRLVEQLTGDAFASVERGDYSAAIRLYSDVVDLRHDRADIYIGRGRAHLELGDYSSAMSDFQRAEDLQPRWPESHVAMGDLYFARKEYRRAIEFYDQAVELDGSHAMARCRRGISHYYRKNYRQAFQDLQRAYSLDPEIPNIRKYVQMAVKKMERGD